MTDELRIDDLAHRTGVPTTTIRLYQHRGLLPGPRLAGRTGWYSAHHVDRLALIARLRDDGHSLAGIKQLLDSWEDGAGLDEVVGAEAGLAALLGGRQAVTLTFAELAEVLPLDAVEPATLQAAVDAGLVELTSDGRATIPDRRFLDAGPALVALGIDSATVVQEWAALTASTDAIAQRFVELFERELLPHGGDDLDALDGPQIRALAADLERLHRIAGQVVQCALDASLARLARDRLRVLADSLTIEAS